MHRAWPVVHSQSTQSCVSCGAQQSMHAEAHVACRDWLNSCTGIHWRGQRGPWTVCIWDAVLTWFGLHFLYDVNLKNLVKVFFDIDLFMVLGPLKSGIEVR